VQLKTFHELRGVSGGNQLETATVFDNRTDEELTLEIDDILFTLGFQSDLGPIKNWGLEFSGRKINVDTMMRTNLVGVYAAGDICTFPGKLNLIATGMGEAGTAANFAKNFLDPKARAMPAHSSERKEN
jgi:ferredoxin/flavodoxin---NADP+ reductase